MKKFFKIYTALMTAVVLLFSNLAGLSAYAFDNSAKEGVVPVVFYLYNADLYVLSEDGSSVLGKLASLGDTPWSHGSGFFVGARGENPQYIVTNHHVIDSYIAASEGETYVDIYGFTNESGNGISDSRDSSHPLPVKIMAQSCEMRVYYSENDYDVAYVDCYGDQEKVDLAVLRLRNPTEKRHSLPILPVSEEMTGSEVYTIGFPGVSENSFTGASKYGVEDVTLAKGIFSKLVMNSGKGVERIETDANIHHGNSGGPMVTEDGKVIGVNTNGYIKMYSLIDVASEQYAISSNELIRFLDKNNISYETASASGSGVIGVIIGIIAAVVIAGAAVAYLMLNKKKQGGNPKAAKKKASKAVIRSLSAQHSGKVFPVGKAAVTVGRNASGCEIVFKEGTPGVSGQHCTVSYDSETGVFTLTDLDSSYGTFLSNGMKLTAHSPINLKPGDSFYVGDKANVLKVELEQ